MQPSHGQHPAGPSWGRRPAGMVAVRELPSARGARFGGQLCRLLLRLGWQVRVFGQDHVPAEGPMILAGNHTGVFDGPLLFGTSPRPVHVLTKREVFVGPVGSVLRGVGQIPLDRWVVDVRALLAALRALAGGRVVGLYPEGERSDGRFARTRDGLAYYALRTGAPVVPVSTFGVVHDGQSTSSPPRLRSRVEVVYGAPFTVQPAEPWGPYLPRRLVTEASERVRLHLREHLRYACELTGHPVPGDARAQQGAARRDAADTADTTGITVVSHPTSPGVHSSAQLPASMPTPGHPEGPPRGRDGKAPAANRGEGDAEAGAFGTGSDSRGESKADYP